MQEHQYYVYLMTNTHHTALYVGVTNDLQRRVFEHRHKIHKGFTQRYNITKLVYVEESSDITAAITREKQIKSWSRAGKEKLINSINPDWLDLYSTLGESESLLRNQP